MLTFRRFGSSSASLAASLTSKTVAAGLFTTPACEYCWTILTKLILSPDRIWYNSPMAWYCVM